MKIINNAVRFPLFDQQELENEKQIVIGELERNESNPFSYFSRTEQRLFSGIRSARIRRNARNGRSGDDREDA